MNENINQPNFQHSFTLFGHEKSVSSLRFSPDGQWLASACKMAPFIKIAADKTVRLWHSSDGRLERTFQGWTFG
jgi:COMPASS component SWD3